MRAGVLFLNVLACGNWTVAGESSLYRDSSQSPITLLMPTQPDPLERFAIRELVTHVAPVSGRASQRRADDSLTDGNRILIGRPENNDAIARLVEKGVICDATP